MSKLKKVFFYLAITGWCLSFIAHLLSFSVIDLDENFPYIWFLHIGIFIVWFPAIITLIKNDKRQLFEFNFEFINPITSFKSMFGHAPKWLKSIVVISFVYAFINFFLALEMFNFFGDIGKIGIYEETNATRIFSGHWLAFYGVASAILYPYKKKEKADGGYTKEYR